LIALCFKKIFHKNNFDFFFNPSAWETTISFLNYKVIILLVYLI
jgi:hypothetical protein